MRYAPAILVGRLVRTLARLRKPGGGSAVPGLVVNKLAPGFLPRTLNSFPRGLVIVSGSSGKSTTTKMLVAILRAHGVSVFTNPSTANISQGLTSALLERANLRGRIDAELGVLEMDEGHGALIAPQLRPEHVILTNVSVDQIDRFHDSAMVQRMLDTIASRSTGSLVLNGDDALVDTLASGSSARRERYGVSAAVLAASPRGLGYTETSAERVDGASGTVVETLAGTATTIVHKGVPVELTLPARGVHYAVDAAAALSGAASILGAQFDPAVAVSAFAELTPVFGRGEVTTVRGQEVEFVLVQNPASFQLNVDSLDADTEQILFAIGSDVRDPSYLWPVDASRLGRVSIVSGLKAWEAALQLGYDGVEIDRVVPDLSEALDAFFELPAPQRGRKTVIFTADSMRRTRAHLGLTSSEQDDA
ncbi:MurT ligase domain-containing protein [Plantibacter sp. YIM 135347]|uniref:MurT ligase domain-containing protein n=1 Tax=Plantibacter sp. YIM 135347 TaxID=3423919 RepID=UPI003D348ED3